MSIEENPHINNLHGVGGVGPSKSKVPGQGPEVAGADFARILEELTAAATNLGKVEPKSSDDPGSIKEAVEEAEKLQDRAISLGESLLEAYRKASVTGDDRAGEQKDSKK